MSKPGLLLAAVAILASSPMPVSAADPGNGGSASVSQPAITRSGPPRIIWFFDGRDDTRDFPTNGFFPGDFAADPFGAAIGAAGLFGSTPRSFNDVPSQAGAGSRHDRSVCARGSKARCSSARR
jgi:hypothetical protein